MINEHVTSIGDVISDKKRYLKLIHVQRGSFLFPYPNVCFVKIS